MVRLGYGERATASWAGRLQVSLSILCCWPQLPYREEVWGDAGGVEVAVFFENRCAGEGCVGLNQELFGPDNGSVGEVADAAQ